MQTNLCLTLSNLFLLKLIIATDFFKFPMVIQKFMVIFAAKIKTVVRNLVQT